MLASSASEDDVSSLFETPSFLVVFLAGSYWTNYVMRRPFSALFSLSRPVP